MSYTKKNAEAYENVDKAETDISLGTGLALIGMALVLTSACSGLPLAGIGLAVGVAGGLLTVRDTVRKRQLQSGETRMAMGCASRSESEAEQ